MSSFKDLMTSSWFDPISERPLPSSPCSDGVAVPLLAPGSSSRNLWLLLEALPRRFGTHSRARFATTTWLLASSSGKEFRSRPAVSPRSLAAKKWFRQSSPLQGDDAVTHFFLRQGSPNEKSAPKRGFVRLVAGARKFDNCDLGRISISLLLRRL